MAFHLNWLPLKLGNMGPEPGSRFREPTLCEGVEELGRTPWRVFQPGTLATKYVDYLFGAGITQGPDKFVGMNGLN